MRGSGSPDSQLQLEHLKESRGRENYPSNMSPSQADKSKTTAACVTHEYSKKGDATGVSHLSQFSQPGGLGPDASVGDTNRTSTLHYISQLSESANQHRFRAEVNS